MRIFSIFLLFLAFNNALSGVAQTADLKKVLVLHSYHVGFTWTDSIQEGIMEELGSMPGVEIFTEYMDTKQTPPELLFPHLATIFELKYSYRDIDVVVTSDDNAFNFVVGTREVLFPDIPLVFCGVNNFNINRLQGQTGITGVPEDVNFLEGTKLILDLLPETKTIAVISDVTATGDLHKEQYQKNVISKLSDRVEFRKLYRLTATNLKKELEQLPPDSAVFNLTFWRDPTGKSFNHRESNSLITEASPAPVFTAWDHTIIYGVLGGIATSGFFQGKTAAKMVKRILNGEKLSEIPVARKSPNIPIFDYSVMQRFGIKKRQLPANSIILNEPESIYYKYKSIVWLTATFILFQMIAIFLLTLNIKKRQAAQTALAESENRFRNVIEFSPLPVAIIDNHGNVIYFNRKITEIFGYTRDEVKHLDDWWVIAYPDSQYRTRTKELWFERIEEGNLKNGEMLPLERRVTCKNGEVRHIEFHYRSLGTIGITLFNDLTERYRSIEEREHIEKRIQNMQKMEAIGTLAGGIAHDFNNILAAILGYAEMAKDESPPGSTVAKDLDQVLEAGERARDLVQQILSFSRQDEVEKVVLQPERIVGQAIKMLRPSLPTTIEISQHITATKGRIFADPTQIHQILMNLCTNAFHAMEETGGKLDISLKEVTVSREDLVQEQDVTAGTFIQLSVCDSGPGIPADIQARIFEPYFTTKETGKGTGMGLAIVHGIVKSYGGFISLSSKAGEGTDFDIFLPVFEKEALPEIDAVEQIPVGKDRILFIDDEEILAEMGKDMLERLGYHVTVRHNSIDALETFQNQPDQFDLIITDQTMPGMTGADIARRMMQIRPDIPIILCTGYSTIMSEEKARSMGIKEFAFKPLSKKDIAMLIRKVLDNNPNQS